MIIMSVIFIVFGTWNNAEGNRSQGNIKDPKHKDIACPIFPCYAAASYLHVPHTTHH